MAVTVVTGPHSSHGSHSGCESHVCWKEEAAPRLDIKEIADSNGDLCSLGSPNGPGLENCLGAPLFYISFGIRSDS